MRFLGWAELCWLSRLRQGLLPINATPDVALGYPFLGGGCCARGIQLALKFTF